MHGSRCPQLLRKQHLTYASAKQMAVPEHTQSLKAVYLVCV